MIRRIRRSFGRAVRAACYRILYGAAPGPEQYYHFGQGAFVQQDCRIEHPQYISIGRGAIVERMVWLSAVIQPADRPDRPRIIIGDGAYVGRFSVIAGMNHVEIGRKVLLAPRVHITDCNHDFEDIDRPIMEQGFAGGGQVFVGDESWVGVNAVIVASRGRTLRIGRHCVIGANTVVTRSVPDYCVVVGAPPRIIRRYCQETKRWLRVNEPLSVAVAGREG